MEQRISQTVQDSEKIERGLVDIFVVNEWIQRRRIRKYSNLWK